MITIISFIVMITMIFIMIMMTKANTQERDSLFVPSMHTSTIVCSALSPWSKTGAFYYPRWNNWWLWPRWCWSWCWWRWWWWQQRWRWHQPCKGILRAGGAQRARCQEPATFCPLCHRTGYHIMIITANIMVMIINIIIACLSLSFFRPSCHKRCQHYHHEDDNSPSSLLGQPPSS